ncbi:MAG: SufD family Fe-S cluster assembly protein [Xanthomonadales bacterium]|nr:SufD family Fe-S cluster assembly protein [Xanthomonadales bacterium]MCE7930636.1 Fe-S cluster assembly protein SufD [Xanthomonadales bacterium PRO6]
MSAALAERLLAALPAPADAQAAAARATFAAAGLPDRRVESWRYSALNGLEGLNPAAGHVEALPPPELAGIAGTLVEQVAGRWIAAPSLPRGLLVRVVAGSERTAESSPAPMECSPLATDRAIRDARAQAFRWLALAAGGEVLEIDVTAPVTGIWRLALQHDAAGLAHTRVRLRVHSGAAITLLVHEYGSDAATGLANRLVEIQLDEGAALSWIGLQEQGARAQSVRHSDLRLAAGARLEHVNLELGGLWSRHTLVIELAGARADARVAGLVALRGRQHHDTRLAITHAMADACSHTQWKAIADARARAVFGGLIAVPPGADGSRAKLRTANLLLSAHAEIDARPELSIETDDVECAHGATVGQLDAGALYYLRTRGVPLAQARQMLTLAFGGEVLAAVGSASLRAVLDARVAAHLPVAE